MKHSSNRYWNYKNCRHHWSCFVFMKSNRLGSKLGSLYFSWEVLENQHFSHHSLYWNRFQENEETKKMVKHWEKPGFMTVFTAIPSWSLGTVPYCPKTQWQGSDAFSVKRTAIQVVEIWIRQAAIAAINVQLDTTNERIVDWRTRAEFDAMPNCADGDCMRGR